jgi:prefoldin beta subunit
MTSEQVNQLLNQAHLYQQQLQSITIQKESLNLQHQEINNALEELNKLKENDVYKLVGPILVKSDKATIIKELQEKKESIEMRMKTLERGEERAKAKIEELREKLLKLGTGG